MLRYFSSTKTFSPKRFRTIHYWLREETKKGEQRTALLPEHAQKLLAAKHQITVEKGIQRCVPDSEYPPGIVLAETGSWKDAPRDAVIMGLKDLPDTFPLIHRHIYFGHCYKGQRQAKQILSRFAKGGGKLYDLEFLVNDEGRRVAAFGEVAGMAGAALGLKAWAAQKLDISNKNPLPPLSIYSSSQEVRLDVKGIVEEALKAHGRPSIALIGSRGRCGTGARTFIESLKLNLEIDKWEEERTQQSGGPDGIPQFLSFDILINCISISKPLRPFLTKKLLEQNKNRKLSVVSDVSCDVYNEKNPLPIVNDVTSFAKPSIRIIDDPPLDVIAIDNLPGLIPRDSSKVFTDNLFVHLLEFDESPVWQRALAIFEEHVKNC